MAEDARVRKTKQKLSAALVALLQEKAFSDITPAQICEKAGINRSTFYRNYKNILQLKTEMENKILAGIQWSSLPTDSFSAKEKSIFDKVRERAIEVAKESIDQVPDAPGEEEYNNLCVFYISAVVGVVEEWFMGGMVQSTESLASFLAPWLSDAADRIGY